MLVYLCCKKGHLVAVRCLLAELAAAPSCELVQTRDHFQAEVLSQGSFTS